MRNDQAADLRALVERTGNWPPRESVEEQPATDRCQPSLVTVIGARQGIGASTVAANLARALRSAGRAVSLVEADQMNDPSAFAQRRESSSKPPAHDRDGLRHAFVEFVIADASGDGPVEDKRLLRNAKRVLLVTTTDTLVLMDAYAKLKSHRRWLGDTELKIVVNRASSSVTAWNAFARLQASARQFLDLKLDLLTSIAAKDERARTSGRENTLTAASS